MPVVDGLPMPIGHRKITPGRPRPGPPHHPVDDLPVVLPSPTPHRRPARQQRLQNLPLLIRQVMAIMHTAGLSHPHHHIRGTRPSRAAGGVVPLDPVRALQHTLYRTAKAPSPLSGHHTRHEVRFGEMPTVSLPQQLALAKGARFTKCQRVCAGGAYCAAAGAADQGRPIVRAVGTRTAVGEGGPTEPLRQSETNY